MLPAEAGARLAPRKIEKGTLPKEDVVTSLGPHRGFLKFGSFVTSRACGKLREYQGLAYVKPVNNSAQGPTFGSLRSIKKYKVGNMR